MSDQHDAGSLPELTPEQESAVRRLLGEARHDEPIPSDVADRLDRTLDDLSRETAGGPSGDGAEAPLVDLATHRRRRNAGRLLVAAAAVIVAGVGVGQVIGTSGGGDADDVAGASRESPGRTADEQEDDDAAAGDSAPTSAVAGLPLTLSSGNLEQEVRDQVAALPSSTKSELLAPLSEDAANGSGESFAGTLPAFPCPPGEYGEGTLLPAYYDGAPTVLALRPVTGDVQPAELLECGTAAPLRSFTLPLR